MSTLEKAVELAFAGHREQFDKAGQPYILHVLRVSNMGKTIDEKICGALHDLVEDTDTTLEDLLITHEFDLHIVKTVGLLTREKTCPYERYIKQISQNKLAIAVKIYDLIDNTDIKRYPELFTRDIMHLNKYLKAYHQLTALQTKT